MTISLAEIVPAEDLLLNSGLVAVSFSDFESPEQLTFRDDKNQPLVVAADQLIRYGHEPIADFASGLMMVDGSWVVGRIERIAKDQVAISGRYFRTTLSLTNVRAIALQLPTQPLARASILKTFTDADGGDDRLLSVAGDEIVGVLQFPPTIDDAPLTFGATWNLQRGERSDDVAASTLRGIVLSPLLHPIRPAETGFWFGLDDGTRLAIRSIRRTGDAIELELASGESLAFAGDWDQFSAAVQSIQPVRGATHWLSQQPALAFKQQASLSELQWPLATDSGLRGEPLSIAGYRYRHGLSMHANAQAAYRIPPDATRFQATIGLATGDDLANTAGSVVFQVLTADATKAVRTQFTSPTLRPGDAPISLDIHLGDAKLIVLMARDAGDGSSGDHAVWADARFLLGNN
ncbi:NPCBM/NEW2 domain-containing protein [Rosistilla carotiformis]|uniref:NPCBM/NEW2 domain-containing protein n=1 Tax=Rosistilla carotiformis TaxID=2528017 RepID=UPI0018D245B7|nr:NPCBM/NEW2 domain-containing protein [Rosistilla carotiformis]